MLHSHAIALGGFNSATLAWRNAVNAAGGSVSPQRLNIVQAFIVAEIASGAWQLTDDYWPLWGENAAQSLVSLKQRRTATAVNSPTFTASRGYTFDGATNYVDTAFVPSTMAVAMGGTNVRITVYERTNLSQNTTAIGTVDGGRILVIRPRNGTTLQGYANSAAINYTLAVADSRGFTTVSRNGAGAAESFAYKNGVAQAQGASSTFSATLPTRGIYIGCQNNAGTPATFRATSIGFACVGAALSAAQELAQYNAVQAFATQVGAQV